MLASDDTHDAPIAGFASIDYRLSGSGTARHPDHILDVRSALSYLADEYQVSNNYVLVGHSAGAMLAFQLIMRDDAVDGQKTPDVPLPDAVIGISGIYDLAGINERHRGQYASFISAAFGGDEKAWDKASPALYSGSFKTNWKSKQVAFVAWSPDDTLVDEPEVDAMADKLTKDGVNVHTVKDLTGEHNHVWEDGSQISSLIYEVLGKL